MKDTPLSPEEREQLAALQARADQEAADAAAAERKALAEALAPLVEVVDGEPVTWSALRALAENLARNGPDGFSVFARGLAETMRHAEDALRRFDV